MSFPRYAAPLSAAEAAEFVPFVRTLLEAARAVVMRHFLTGVEVISKADASPVTQADRGAEAELRRLIEARYPSHGILGEEYGEKPAQGSAYRWVLDPVDGTRAFITHCFLFGTLIALERDGQPVLGAIAHPAAGLSLIGHAGGTQLVGTDGATRAVRVRPCTNLSEATLLATTHWSTGEQSGGPSIEPLIRRAKLYRTWGDCFGYFSLATGGADVMLDPSLAHWDVAAIVPVVEGAGGRVTGWRGGDPLAERSLIATAGPLHDEVLAALHAGASA